MISTLLLIALSAAVGLPHILGRHGKAYQAGAHLWVGGLIGAWAASGWQPVYLWNWVGLSILEVACFLYYGKQTS